MQQGVKISEVIDLIHKTEPIGTAEDRFARGGNYLKRATLLRTVDYILTALYLSGIAYGIYSLVKIIL